MQKCDKNKSRNKNNKKYRSSRGMKRINVCCDMTPCSVVEVQPAFQMNLLASISLISERRVNHNVCCDMTPCSVVEVQPAFQTNLLASITLISEHRVNHNVCCVMTPCSVVEVQAAFQMNLLASIILISEHRVKHKMRMFQKNGSKANIPDPRDW